MKNIRRSARDRRGFVVYNETANDLELTAEALGVLVYILSKPDHWQVNVSDLQRRRGMGRDKAYRVLRELIANRYAQFVEYYGHDGRVVDSEYVIYDVRQPEGLEPRLRLPLPERPDTEKPDTAEPDTANPEHSINLVVVNTELKKDSLSESATTQTAQAENPPRPQSGRRPPRAPHAQQPPAPENLPGAAIETSPKDELETWEGGFLGFKRALIHAAKKDPAVRPHYFTLARAHRQVLAYALSMGAKNSGKDTETFRAWLPDLVRHVEAHGAEAVAAALQEAIKRAGSSPWGFYVKLLGESTPTPAAPAATAIDYNDPAARAELYKRLPLAGEKRRRT